MKEDTELLRRVAKALADDGHEAAAIRELIDENVPVKKPITFKKWLAEPSEEE